MSVCLSVTFAGIGRALEKIKSDNIVDIDICYRMALLRKLFSVTFTFFLKVKDLNLHLLTVASNQSDATCANKHSNRDLATQWRATIHGRHLRV